MFEGRGGLGAMVQTEEGEDLMLDLLALSRRHHRHHDCLLKGAERDKLNRGIIANVRPFKCYDLQEIANRIHDT